MRHATIGGLIGLLIVSACMDGEVDDGSEPPGPKTCLDPDIPESPVPDWPIVHSTEHLDIHIEEGRFVCAGTALDLERHVEYVSRELGVEVERRIPVYRIDSTEHWCPGGNGCIKADGVVFASTLALHHEIAHAVACEARIGVPPLLSEGLAVSFEPIKNDRKGDPTEFSEFSPTEFNGAYYNRAGHFVRWLLEELGREAFMELYTTVNYDDGVWTAIEDAYGLTVADDYAAESPAMWVPHRQCADLPILEPVDGTWTFAGRVDCSDPATFGPYEREDTAVASVLQSMYRTVLIEIETPGSYIVERRDFGSEDKTWVWFERCLDEHPADEDAIEAEWEQMTAGHVILDVGTVEFEHAGLWRMDMLRDHGPAWDIEVVITPEPSSP